MTKFEDWRVKAACAAADVDPELFFPVGTGDDAISRAREAKKYCVNCAVLTDCLSEALETRQDDGVWGSLDEEQRKEILKAYHDVKPRKGRTVADNVSSGYYDGIMIYAKKYLDYKSNDWKSDLS